MQEYILPLLSLLSEYAFLVAFVAPFFGGETAVLGLAFLAGQGTFSLVNLIVGSFLGMLVLDIMWFLLVRFPINDRMKKWGATSPNYLHMQEQINSFTRGNDLLILFISKVLIGTRILILAYLGMRKISFARFVLSDSIATFVWAVILGSIGWLSGRGYVNAVDAYQSFAVGIFCLILVVGIFYFLLITTRKWILRS